MDGRHYKQTLRVGEQTAVSVRSRGHEVLRSNAVEIDRGIHCKEKKIAESSFNKTSGAGYAGGFCWPHQQETCKHQSQWTGDNKPM